MPCLQVKSRFTISRARVRPFSTPPGRRAADRERVLGLIDRVVWVPDVDQRAGGEIHQLVTAFQPGFNGSALLFVDRATLGQAHQTEVIAADIAQAVNGHGVTQELLKKAVDGLISQVLLEVQVQLKTQLFGLTI